MKTAAPWLFLFVLFTTFSASPARTQSTEGTSDHPYVLPDTVVVTGSRIVRPQRSVSATVTVVGRETLEDDTETNVLPTVASTVPGVFLQQRTTTGFGIGPGSGGNISIRGISGQPNTRILMLIDGQPQFMGIFGHPISDTYATQDVERVEVIRGAASVLYGSNAMAGAINLVTRRSGREGWSTSAMSSFGSETTSENSLSAQYREGPTSVFTGLTFNRTDGHRDDFDDGFENLGGTVKVERELGAQWRLVGDLNLVDAEYEQPNAVGVASAPADSIREYLRGRTSIALHNRSERLEGTLRAFYSWGDHEFSDGFDSNDFYAGLSAHQSLRTRETTVTTFGVDLARYGGDARNPSAGGDLVDETLDQVDVYGFLEQGLPARFDLTAGLRFVKNFDLEEGDTQWLPYVGLTHQLTGSTTMRASAGRSFRNPTLLDLFLFPPANAELEPESMWSTEAGVDQWLLGRRLRVELTGFVAEGDNLVQVVLQEAGPPRRLNSGEFSHAGVETGLRWFPVRQLEFRLGYTWLDTEDPELLAPAHDLSLTSTYRHERFRLTVGAHAVSDLYTSLPSPAGGGTQEDYVLLDASLHVPVGHGVTAFVRGENLTDTEYEIDRGYPMPGATVMAGLRLER